MHPEAILIRGIATGPPPSPEGGGGASSWQTEGLTAGARAVGGGAHRINSIGRLMVFLEILDFLA